MSGEADSGANDVRFVEEQLQFGNRLLVISRQFIDPDQRDAVSALFAFFAAIERICGQVSEIEVAMRKIDWWRQECFQTGIEHSLHPLLRELTRTGAAERIPRGDIEALFRDAEFRLDAPPPANDAELLELVQRLGQPQVRLECAVLGQPEAATEIGSRVILQLLRESLAEVTPHAFWWIPMNFLARHGITRAQILADEMQPSSRALMQELLTGLAIDAGPVIERDTPLHPLLLEQLSEKKLGKLASLAPTAFASSLNRIRISDMWKGWGVARRLRYAGHV